MPCSGTTAERAFFDAKCAYRSAIMLPSGRHALTWHANVDFRAELIHISVGK